MASPIIYDRLGCVPSQPNISCRLSSGTFSTISLCSSILGAADNTQTMCAEYSTIIMGNNNTIDPFVASPNLVLGCFNTISNGYNNLVCGYWNSVHGGSRDIVRGGCGNTVVGGGSNVIERTASGYANCGWNAILK